MLQPLKTRIRVLISQSKTDISKDITNDLLAWSYSDRESGQADDISLTLKDPQGRWANNWKPDGGEQIRLYISTGTVDRKGVELYCGLFYIDSIRFTGPPKIATIKAISIPLQKTIRKLAKTRAWEQRTLKDIAQSIAKEGDLEFLFDSEVNPTYDRIDQTQESDLAFLKRLSDDAGLSLKVSDSQLIIFSQEIYESKAAVRTILLESGEVINFDFETCQSDSYKSVTVKWRDPKQKKKATSASYNFNLEKVATKTSNPAVMSYTYRDPQASDSDQEYFMKRRAKSKIEAERLAKAKLRALNAKRVTATLTLVGSPLLLSGSVVRCIGFGSFDGNFLIEESTHTGGTSGYTTNIRLRRVNKEY